MMNTSFIEDYQSQLGQCRMPLCHLSSHLGLSITVCNYSCSMGSKEKRGVEVVFWNMLNRIKKTIKQIQITHWLARE